ncbi:hypothetical protein JCM8547_007231 [Rhodosporidiobolus lusitaniae]
MRLPLLPLTSLLLLSSSFSSTTALPSPPSPPQALQQRHHDLDAPRPALAPRAVVVVKEEEKGFVKRDHLPTLTIRHEHEGEGEGEGVEKRQIAEVRPRPGLPPRDFEPDNSGRGYAVDYRGRGPPSWAESDFHFFGRSVGWAPYRGWRPPSVRWVPPSQLVEVWVEVEWWVPPANWLAYWYSRWRPSWPVPRHWKWQPQRRPTATSCPPRRTVTVTETVTRTRTGRGPRRT